MEHKKEKIVEVLVGVLSLIIIFKLIPREKSRPAVLAYLFKLVITWLFGLLVVEKDAINYPVRLFFKNAYKGSFTFEYIAYPTLCALFNSYYPEKKGPLVKLCYYLFHTGFIIIGEVLALKYTKLIQYENWKWYWSFTTIWFTYYCSRLFHRWFFRGRLFITL